MLRRKGCNKDFFTKYQNKQFWNFRTEVVFEKFSFGCLIHLKADEEPGEV